MGASGQSYRDTVSKAAAALPLAGGTLTGKLNFVGGTSSVVPGGCTVTSTVHAGEGDMAVAAGTRSGMFEIEFITAGELAGDAKFKWKFRGGEWQDNAAAGYPTAADVVLTYDTTVPSGQHVQFSAGPGGGDDFAVGDTYSFTSNLEVTFTEQGQEVSIPLVTPAGEYDDIIMTCVGSHAAFPAGPFPSGAGAFTTGQPRLINFSVSGGLITARIKNDHATDPINGDAKMIILVMA